MELKINQTVWVSMHDFRGWAMPPIERTVAKVGSKFYTLSDGTKFDKEDGLEATRVGYRAKLYLSLQDYEGTQEAKLLNAKLARLFGRHNNVPIEALRTIDLILKDYYETI